ncbi:hypothetical protein OAN22_01070 [Alphaproteobacteria bacterium]|nr:hypothetical protein [Alphaproteobacteria bacterium]
MNHTLPMVSFMFLASTSVHAQQSPIGEIVSAIAGNIRGKEGGARPAGPLYRAAPQQAPAAPKAPPAPRAPNFTPPPLGPPPSFTAPSFRSPPSFTAPSFQSKPSFTPPPFAPKPLPSIQPINMPPPQPFQMPDSGPTFDEPEFRFNPFTGDPMPFRFDPYTGEPIDSPLPHAKNPHRGSKFGPDPQRGPDGFRGRQKRPDFGPPGRPGARPPFPPRPGFGPPPPGARPPFPPRPGFGPPPPGAQPPFRPGAPVARVSQDQSVEASTQFLSASIYPAPLELVQTVSQDFSSAQKDLSQLTEEMRRYQMRNRADLRRNYFQRKNWDQLITSIKQEMNVMQSKLDQRRKWAKSIKEPQNYATSVMNIRWEDDLSHPPTSAQSPQNDYEMTLDKSQKIAYHLSRMQNNLKLLDHYTKAGEQGNVGSMAAEKALTLQARKLSQLIQKIPETASLLMPGQSAVIDLEEATSQTEIPASSAQENTSDDDQTIAL